MLETVAEVAEDWRIDDVKGLLGRCNFKADMLDRKVSLLSGGEKVCTRGFLLSSFHGAFASPLWSHKNLALCSESFIGKNYC